MLDSLRGGLQRLKEAASPATSFIQKTAQTFRGAYTSLTSAVERSMKQPALLPYTPPQTKSVVEKQEQSTAQDYLQQMEAGVRATLQEFHEQFRTILHRHRYDNVLEIQESIDAAIHQLRGQKDTTSSEYQKTAAALEQAQFEIRKVFQDKLQLRDDMDRFAMERSLSGQGYIRMKRGDVGYAQVINTIEPEDRVHLEADGGVWVHEQVVRMAERPLNYQGVKDTCWQMVDTGETPIFHLPRLMQIFGYEPAPALQETYRMSDGTLQHSFQTSYTA